LGKIKTTQSSPKEIIVRLHVRDIINVDAVGGTVSMDFTVQLFWYDESLVGVHEVADWDTKFSPDIEVYNGLSLESETFTEIVVRPKKLSVNEVVFKTEDKWTIDQIFGSETATGVMECNIGIPTIKIEALKRHTSDEIFTCIKLSLPMRRIYGFYVWRVMLVAVIITALSWSTFDMDPSDLPDRLSVNLTLILSIVAFMFVVNDSLPKVPYLTFIDKLMTISFAFLFLACIENWMVYNMLTKQKYSQGVTDKIDSTCLWLFPTVYVVTTIILIILLIIRKSKTQNWEMIFPEQGSIFRGRRGTL